MGARHRKSKCDRSGATYHFVAFRPVDVISQPNRVRGGNPWISGCHTTGCHPSPLRLRRPALLWQGGRISLQDLDPDDAWEVEAEGSRDWCRLKPTGTIAVLGDIPGIIRVGRIGGGPAHWLPGRVRGDIVVSPDGAWVASGGEDDTIRL